MTIDEHIPTAKKDHVSTETKKPWINWIGQLVIIAITAIAAGAATYWFTEYSDRVRAFKYQVISSPSIIKKVDLRGKQLQVMIDQKPIQNISTVRVAIFNTTGRNYEEVPVEIAFSPINGKTPILMQGIPQTPPETFEETKLTDMGDNSLRLGYKIKVCNNSNNALFYADYIFEGEQAPNVYLAVRKKGLDIVEMPQIANEKRDIWSLSSFMWGAVVAAIVNITFLGTKEWIDYRAKKGAYKIS